VLSHLIPHFWRVDCAMDWGIGVNDFDYLAPYCVGLSARPQGIEH